MKTSSLLPDRPLKDVPLKKLRESWEMAKKVASVFSGCPINPEGDLLSPSTILSRRSEYLIQNRILEDLGIGVSVSIDDLDEVFLALSRAERNRSDVEYYSDESDYVDSYSELMWSSTICDTLGDFSSVAGIGDFQHDRDKGPGEASDFIFEIYNAMLDQDIVSPTTKEWLDCVARATADSYNDEDIFSLLSSSGDSADPGEDSWDKFTSMFDMAYGNIYILEANVISSKKLYKANEICSGVCSDECSFFKDLLNFTPYAEVFQTYSDVNDVRMDDAARSYVCISVPINDADCCPMEITPFFAELSSKLWGYLIQEVADRILCTEH